MTILSAVMILKQKLPNTKKLMNYYKRSYLQTQEVWQGWIFQRVCGTSSHQHPISERASKRPMNYLVTGTNITCLIFFIYFDLNLDVFPLLLDIIEFLACSSASNRTLMYETVVKQVYNLIKNNNNESFLSVKLVLLKIIFTYCFSPSIF